MKSVLDRFLGYVKVETTSDPKSTTFPSTETQITFLKALKEECESIGLTEVTMDEYGYVMATVPATCDEEAPVIGFIAHVDTSPDMSGKDVKPQIIENYDGSDLVLNEAEGIVTKVCDFPELKNFVGQTLIATDGTTLLGADDKAGVAEILTAAEYLINNPQIKHGKIRVAFTPDEEIGHGADHFSVERFGADFGYTLDGGQLGSLEYETFNAASANITVHGRNVHPGYAKDKMINSIEVAMQINASLPNERPQNTCNREGFYHLNDFKGNVEVSTMSYIIRDHSKEIFEKRKETIKAVCEQFNTENCVVECVVKDSYFNMADVITNGHMEVVEKAKQAMEEIGVTPKISPIRGGTDGSRLSFMGLPCPNIFSGGVNIHGRNEFASLQTLEKAVEFIIEVVKVNR
ncbi:MAG: peptidase T [Rikenellaceae bacterium]